MLTGMRLITGLELLFWFLAMITRICFKFEGKEKKKNKITTGEVSKAIDTGKQNRIDEMEDTIRKINLKLEMIETDLSKTKEF